MKTYDLPNIDDLHSITPGYYWAENPLREVTIVEVKYVEDYRGRLLAAAPCGVAVKIPLDAFRRLSGPLPPPTFD